MVAETSKDRPRRDGAGSAAPGIDRADRTSAGTQETASDGIFPCQAELLELLDLLIDVIFCLKAPDGRYVAANAAFVRRTGRSSKRDVVGRRAVDLFLPELAERYEAQDERVLATGEALRDELELIRREDGSHGWYLTTKLPVRPDRATGRTTPAGVASISKDLRVPREDDIDVQALQRVVDHVRTNLTETIRVADMASAAELSPSQLERRMRRVFGISATKYVLRARVDRAAELLIDTDLPLAEIAQAAGFYDQADLTHRFARLTNETPAQFRVKGRR